MKPKLKEHTYPAIKSFIKQHVEETGGNGVVIGLSGGVDSATVSKLCADAIGPSKVLNVFMPSKTSSPQDRQDVEDFCRQVGMELMVVDIEPMVEAFGSVLPFMDDNKLRGNVMARCRMIILYHQARRLGRVVMGTSNKSELLTGYFTKFGDGGADFCPIGDLYKTQVLQLAAQIGVPKTIIEKVPSAGLWEGQSDEGELGISYEDLDSVLLGFEHSMSDEYLSPIVDVPLETVQKVWAMYKCSVHKRKMPLIPKVAARTLGSDWRE